MVSHGESVRDSCSARGVRDLAIGSSDWLGSVLVANEAASMISKYFAGFAIPKISA
jgi:hypothetical protein